MEERILVPLNGSEIGEAVLPKLEDLVLKTVSANQAEITLLRVISRMNFNVLTNDDRAQLPISEEDMTVLTKEAKEYLERVAEGMRAKGFNVKTMVADGHAAEKIVEVARDIKANLIAMATHGRSGVVRWAIGSVTDKVIRLEGQIPVMAIKASEKQESPVLPLESLQSLVKHAN